MANISILIGLRYSLSRKQSHLVAFISRISTLGMVLAVSVLVLVTSVMNGFDTALKDRILGIVPHVTLTQTTPFNDWQTATKNALKSNAVVAASPFSYAQAMVLNGQHIKPVVVMAYDKQYEPENSIMRAMLQRQGLGADLANNEIIISPVLAKKLGKSKGDQLTIMVAQPDKASPELFTLVIKGFVATGTQFDQKLMLANYQQVARLQHWPESAVKGIRLYLADIFNAYTVANQLSMTLGFSESTHWMQAQGNLYQAVQLSRKMVVFLVLIIIAIAAFNLVSTLVLAVNDKAADIAILKTMGCSQQQILMIFVFQAVIIGFIGVTIGLIFGVLAALGIGPFLQFLEQLFNYQFLATEVYPVDYLPVDIRLGHIILIVSMSLLLCFIASILPALRAMRLQPAQVLRYE